MTKLGIWRLMVHHQQKHHHHLLNRHRKETRCDDSEIIVKAPHKHDKLCQVQQEYDDDDAVVEDETVSQSTTSAEFFEPTLVAYKEEEDAAASCTCRGVEVSLKKTRHVSFSDVQVRTYEQILGDNPDCSFPLSLGWRYCVEHDKLDIDTYERQRGRRIGEDDNKRLSEKDDEEEDDDDWEVLHLATSPTTAATVTRTIEKRSSRPVFPLTLHERRLRLRAAGHSEQDLRQAERRRRIELALQWASGQYPKQADYPYSHRYFLNYVL